MAFRKNSNTENDVFCLTLPLICEPWQRDRLDKIFKASTFIKNSQIQNRLNALKQLERTKRWKQLQTQFKSLNIRQIAFIPISGAGWTCSASAFRTSQPAEQAMIVQWKYLFCPV